MKPSRTLIAPAYVIPEFADDSEGEAMPGITHETPMFNIVNEESGRALSFF